MPLSMVPVFLLVLMVRLGENLDWLPVWGRSYVDDLVAIPLVLWLIRLAHRGLRKNSSWLLPMGHGLLAVVFFIFLFEIILPEFFNRGTSDYWDGVMYIVGFVYFQLLVNQAFSRGAGHQGLS